MLKTGRLLKQFRKELKENNEKEEETTILNFPSKYTCHIGPVHVPD